MKINEQYQKVNKEYILEYGELAYKLGIPDEIDHIWLGQQKIGIVTKWKEAHK